MYKRAMALAAGTVASAWACAVGPWTMTWSNYGNGYNWMPFSISNGTTTENNVYAGSVLLTATNADTTLNIESYCVSPFVWLQSPWQADQSYNSGVTTDIAKLAGVAVGGDQDLGAAVQLAIWSDVTGPSFTWSGGNATIAADYTALVNGTYAGIPNDTPNYYFWAADPTGTSQDMISLAGGYHDQTTPEPCTLTVCLVGLGLVAARRRRRAR